MFRRTTAILLFVTLASGNAAATTLCASLSQGADQTPERHCNMTQESSASMVCCQHKLGSSSEPLSNEVSRCCQMSAPRQTCPAPLYLLIHNKTSGCKLWLN